MTDGELELAAHLVQHTPLKTLNSYGRISVCCRCDITWRSADQHAYHIVQTLKKKVQKNISANE